MSRELPGIIMALSFHNGLQNPQISARACLIIEYIATQLKCQVVRSDFRFIQIFVPLTADVDAKHLLNVAVLLFGSMEIICKALDLELSCGAAFGQL